MAREISRKLKGIWTDSSRSVEELDIDGGTGMPRVEKPVKKPDYDSNHSNQYCGFYRRTNSKGERGQFCSMECYDKECPDPVHSPCSSVTGYLGLPPKRRPINLPSRRGYKGRWRR